MAMPIIETAILRENLILTAPRIWKIHKKKAKTKKAKKSNEQLEKEVNLKAEIMTPG